MLYHLLQQLQLTIGNGASLSSVAIISRLQDEDVMFNYSCILFTEM